MTMNKKKKKKCVLKGKNAAKEKKKNQAIEQVMMECLMCVKYLHVDI
jgi:hypothetical protein